MFKGSLADGQLVAIKKLNKGTSEEQIIGFLSEIGTIAHVDHPNTTMVLKGEHILYLSYSLLCV